MFYIFIFWINEDMIADLLSNDQLFNKGFAT